MLISSSVCFDAPAAGNRLLHLQRNADHGLERRLRRTARRLDRSVGEGAAAKTATQFCLLMTHQTRRVDRTAGGGGPSGARLALILAGIGALAATPGLLWYFVWRADRGAAVRAREPSIAVLPFVNLSSDKENEYFSDGVTEEIINALANVEGVRVVARTSAFSFKGKNLNVRKIGEELNVATVLEGSVRRQGTQIRIAA